MSKLKILFIFIFSSFTFSIIPLMNLTLAGAPSCQSIGVQYSTNPLFIPQDTDSVLITFTNITNGRYQMRSRAGLRDVYENQPNREKDAFEGILVLTITRNDDKLTWGTHEATLEKWNEKKNGWEDYCGFIKYKVGYQHEECRLSISPLNPRDNEQFVVNITNSPKGDYPLVFVPETSLDKEDREFLGTSISTNKDGKGQAVIGPLTPRKGTLSLYDGSYVRFINLVTSSRFCLQDLTIASGGTSPVRATCSIYPPSPTPKDVLELTTVNLPTGQTFRVDLDGTTISRDVTLGGSPYSPGNNLPEGSHTINVYDSGDQLVCTAKFEVKEQKPPPGSGGGGGGGQLPGVGVIKCKDPTASDFDPNVDTACSSAAGQECRAGRGIDTAIGCIPTHPVELVRGFVRFAIGIAGGIALLLMIFGAFTMITSAGNPDRINEGRERFSSAIIGLLVIIFAVLLMRLIGVDILGLDRFLGV